MEPGEMEETWDWAHANNLCIPKCDRARGARLDISLSTRIKSRLATFSEFANRESAARKRRMDIPTGWKTLCALTNSGYFLYAPRWTYPLFYFSGYNAGAFSGLSGLDVGARVSRSTDDPFKKTPITPPSENPMLRETFVPHWRHYEHLGASMRAIDVIPDAVESRIEFGDARLLMFPNKSFDFLTVPMLLGPGNPCSTVLEIVVCLREMYRVLRVSGFVHIADATLHPSVCYAAELAGFKVAYSKKFADDTPVGTFLLKHSEMAVSTLARFPKLLALPTLSLSSTSSEIISHCNLIADPEEPVVRLGALKCMSSAVA